MYTALVLLRHAIYFKVRPRAIRVSEATLSITNLLMQLATNQEASLPSPQQFTCYSTVGQEKPETLPEMKAELREET